MKRLVLLGDSHTATYARAVKNLNLESRIVGGPLGAASLWFQPFYRVDVTGRLQWTNEVIARNFLRWSNMTGVTALDQCGRVLVLSLGLAPAYFYGHPMWSRNCGSRSNLHISENMIDDMILELQREVLRFYTLAHERGWLHSAIVAPSVQKRHKAIKILGEERVRDLAIRFRQPVLDFLVRNRIAIIDVSSQSDELGFLKQLYWGIDHAHGNIAYGALVINQLLRLEDAPSAQQKPTCEMSPDRR